MSSGELYFPCKMWTVRILDSLQRRRRGTNPYLLGHPKVSRSYSFWQTWEIGPYNPWSIYLMICIRMTIHGRFKCDSTFENRLPFLEIFLARELTARPKPAETILGWCFVRLVVKDALTEWNLTGFQINEGSSARCHHITHARKAAVGKTEQMEDKVLLSKNKQKMVCTFPPAVEEVNTFAFLSRQNISAPLSEKSNGVVWSGLAFTDYYISLGDSIAYPSLNRNGNVNQNRRFYEITV